MMFDLHRLASRDSQTGCVNVVIDTPRGSRNKFKFDEGCGLFRLAHILPIGMTFPFDFGSVPRTRAEDGDALDVLVLIEAPTFPGCLLGVQLIGILCAQQKESGRVIKNDRLLAVPVTPVNDPSHRDIRDLRKPLVDEVASFFVAYNRAQGREFIPGGRRGPKAAERILETAMRAYARLGQVSGN
jgi:inorganic pyrophosphatase